MVTFKKYFVKNRKKNISILLALLICITSVTAWVTAKRTNASVIVKDKDGNKVIQDEIRILEIVAREGQQVLGYTVEGQEPISVSDIENYEGDMDLDVDDFESATGYQVTKSQTSAGKFKYHVEGNILNNTFNENVFAQQMNKGEILVKAVQASDLKVSDIETYKPDLVYINSNDYNENLLYYYDQFKYNGAMGIEAGNAGEGYNSVYTNVAKKYDTAVNKIINSLGYADKTMDIVLEDFEFIKMYHAGHDEDDPVNLDNYQSYNFSAYLEKLTATKEGTVSNVISEAIPQINELLGEVNEQAKEDAIQYIINISNNQEITDEEVAALSNALQRTGVSGYNTLNDEAYIERIKTYVYYGYTITKNDIIGYGTTPSLIAAVNLEEAAAAINDLLTYKTKVDDYRAAHPTDPTDPADPTDPTDPSSQSSVDENGLTMDDYIDLFACLQRADIASINNDFANEYFEAFLAEDFVFDGGMESVDALRGIITGINNTHRVDALTRFSDLPAASDDSLMEAFTTTAKSDFKLMDLKGYNEYYLEKYIDAIRELTDAQAFKTDGSYDESKMESFLNTVNTTVDIYETSFSTGDIPWKVAETLYNAVSSEETALVYNVDMLTNGTIGKYNEDLSEMAQIQTSDYIREKGVREVDNTNNIYKVLLLLRQVRDTYYTNELSSKIDELGNFYPNGIDSGDTPVASWNKETFGTDYDNYAKYREPDVVGTVYDTDGTQGISNGNYVYKRIYSYSGKQFFGGSSFVKGLNSDESVNMILSGGLYSDSRSADAGGIITDSSQLEDSNYFLLYVGNSNIYNFKTHQSKYYVHLWNAAEQSAPKEFYEVTQDTNTYDNNWYRVPIIGEYTNFLFTTAENYNEKTSNYRTNLSATQLEGRVYNLNGSSGVSDVTNSGWNYAMGGITNSITNGTVQYVNIAEGMRFWMYYATNYGVKASYRITVDGNVLYSGNDDGYHYTNGYTAGVTTSQEFTLNDEIKIYRDRIVVGDDTINQYINGAPLNITNGSVVTITFSYSTPDNYGGGTRNATRTYNYKCTTAEPYNMNITNFAKDGTVEFANGADFTFNFDNVNNVTYVYSGNSYSVSNGQTVTLGSELSVGASEDLIVRYTPIDGSEVTVKTTLKSIEPTMQLNYLSALTASNSSPLQYNPLLSSSDNARLVGMTKGGVIRYLLNVSLTDVNYPINVLEIQPAAAISELSDYNGAVKLADYFNIDAAADGMNSTNYTDYFNVKSMSVKEFNTRNEDLTANYDLIYFGVQTGYQVVNTYKSGSTTFRRTYYNDKDMNGLVYTGIGDIYNVQPFLRGVAASDYYPVSNYTINNGDQISKYEQWKKYFSSGLTDNDNPEWNLNINNTGGGTRRYYLLYTSATTTRLSGNDLTVMRMNDLLNYLKAGYPVLLADEIMDCNIYQNGKIVENPYYVNYNGNSSTVNALRWKYVDTYSKMYNFVKQAKELGLDASGNYTVSSDFKDGKTYASLVSVSNAKNGRNPEYLSANEKFKGGLSFANRRISKVDFEYVSGPQEYNKNTSGAIISNGNLGTVIRNSDIQHKQFEMVLDVKRNGGIDESELDGRYNYMVYVDKSGIGKFEEIDLIEIDCEHEFIKNSEDKVTQVKVSGKWPGDIEGFIPWKLELSDKNNDEWKFSYTGFSSFERTDSQKKDVYVVWIYPATGLTLNFRDVLQENVNSLNQTEFNIHLIALSYAQFNSTWSGMSDDTEFTDENSRLKVATMYNRRSDNNKCWNLKGDEDLLTTTDIDMIVVGFSDSHAEMDISSIAALNNIQYFLDEGHSMLYSHDNSSFWTSLNWYVDADGNHGSGDSTVWGRYTTVFFRRMLGMDQYGVTYGSDSNIPEEYANARLYLDENDINQVNFRGITENCVFHYSPTANGIKGGTALYSNNINSSSANGYTNWSHTNSVMKTNRGQITEYPYILGDTIKTATTHAQYCTITLEDPDLTVWYTLDTAQGTVNNGSNPQLYKFTKGDGANNYYIYSKGNITYTGSGHASGMTADEKKLFINTVIASIKIPNFKPIVTLKSGYKKDGETYVDYITGSTGVNITFNPTDNDMKAGTNAFTDCKIFVDIDGDGEYTPGVDVLINDPDDVKLSNTEGVHENVVGTELKNREDKTFRLTSDDITAINDKIKLSEPTKSKSIYDYRIVLAVSDKGYLKSSSANPTPAVGTASFKLAEKTTPTYELFSLK